MAKTTAPLLSFGAAGQIGKTQVYATWKGRSYARRYTTPANPRSSEQTLTRDTFAWLQAVYKLLPGGATAPWELFAKGKVLTARNAFTKFNLAALREETDLAFMTGSPGALGGPPPVSASAVGGSGTLQVTVVDPATTPVDWTQTFLSSLAIRDQDPQSGTLYSSYFETEAEPSPTVTFLSLPAGNYWTFTWLQWLRPDGLIAYSPSIADAATVT